MVKKSTLLYIIGAIIYIACFGYIVSDLAQTKEGRILIFIYSTSIILTTVIICLGYKISKALLGILDKYTNTKVWYYVWNYYSNLSCSWIVNIHFQY